ncbi:hypothetical protein J4E80_005903 [Alternaria sp. BMP 0032]|nr:hypothetical protein J4E80_005903 [Alternaria sp. BMP 0032]
MEATEDALPTWQELGAFREKVVGVCNEFSYLIAHTKPTRPLGDRPREATAETPTATEKMTWVTETMDGLKRMMQVLERMAAAQNAGAVPTPDSLTRPSGSSISHGSLPTNPDLIPDSGSASSISPRPGSTLGNPSVQSSTFVNPEQLSRNANLAPPLLTSSAFADAAAKPTVRAPKRLKRGHHDRASGLSDPVTEAGSGHTDESAQGDGVFVRNVFDFRSNTTATLEILSRNPAVRKIGMGVVKVQDLRKFHPAPDAFEDQESVHWSSIEFRKDKHEMVIVRAVSDDELPHPEELRDQLQNMEDDQDHEYSSEELKDMFEYPVEPGSTNQARLYLIGPTSMLGASFNPLLDAGKRLKEALTETVAGVNESYAYVSMASGQRTATAMHIEDCEWSSVNILLAGQPKVWLSIEPAFIDTLTARLRQVYATDLTHWSCSQTIRHLNVFIPPSSLREWGIPYHIRLCRRGEAVFTTPRALHQVINLGDNVAEAVNFALSSADMPPLFYEFCVEGVCGENPLQFSSFRGQQGVKRNPSEEPQQRNVRSRRKAPTEDQTSQLLARMRKLSLCENVNLDAGAYTKGVRVAASVLSKGTLHQIKALVRTWRSQKPESMLLQQNDAVAEVACFHRQVMDIENERDHDLFRLRVAEYQFAHSVRLHKNKDKMFIHKVLQRLGIEPTKKALKAFNNVYSRRAKWLSICENCPGGSPNVGILALIPFAIEAPYYVSSDMCKKITYKDVSEFSAVMNQSSVIASALLRVGVRIYDLYNKSEEFEFEFEHCSEEAYQQFGWNRGLGEDLDDHDDRDPGLGWLGHIRQHFNANSGPDHHCSDDDEWDTDPTTAEPGAKCQICSVQAPCQCLRFPPNAYRIKRDYDRGRYVEAAATLPEGILIGEVIGHRIKRDYDRGRYVEAATTLPEGILIGEVIGQLVPLTTETDDDMLVLHSDTEALCKIKRSEQGNWTRFVKQEGTGNVKFESLLVNGHWRVLLRTLEVVHAGTQLVAIR